MSGFLEYSGQKRYVFSDLFDKELFSAHIDYVLEHYDEVFSEASSIAEKMSALSYENAKIASNIFREGRV